MPPATACRRYRLVMSVFILGLVLSGLTAFPLQTELRLLTAWLGLDQGQTPATTTGLAHWLLTVRDGLTDSYSRYPWLGYGTDWLAFGHLVIALFFVDALRRPAASRWLLTCGLLACAGVIPLALLAGAVRGIPLGWRLIDCSFGVLGALPLLYCRQLLRHLGPPPA